MSNLPISHNVIETNKLETTLKVQLKLLNRDENIVTKWEITHYKQFLLLPQFVLMSSAVEASHVYVWWKGLTNKDNWFLHERVL